MEAQSRRLPLLLALVAFAVYVATMGGELTLNGLTLAVKLAGWEKNPMVGQPLLWLLTMPLRVLPAAWLCLAIKVLAAALAAIILGLVARTVQLLPWDHAWEQVGRFTSALPILAAVVACGLEFNFWQEATSVCSDLLDLLPIAVAVWLLLEYNVRQQSGWTDAAAVVWGAGMAENWVMLLALPLFIAAVIWLEGLRFFRAKFILRMAGLGLAGFAIYAVLPMANGLTPHGPWTLGQSWTMTWRQTKGIFLELFNFWRGHHLLVLAVLIYYLVPTLPLLIRMRDEGTRNKSGVDRFQIWLYRSLRVGLLVACLWLAFDPLPGARQMLHQNLIGWPLLTLDYLVAIGAAFLMGNLLLIPHIVIRDKYRRPRTQILWQRLAAFISAASLALIAVGLLVRNAPAVVHGNFHSLERFGDLAVKSLPPGRGVLLSDDSLRLDAFRAALARSRRAADWLAVDTRRLPDGRYRAELEKNQSNGWLTDKRQRELNPLETLLLLEHLMLTNRLFYLHPSFGHFFEGFYLEPTGTVFEMKLRGREPLAVPPQPPAVLAANDQIWTGVWNTELSALVQPAPRPLSAAKWNHFGLTAAPRDQDRLLAQWFSISLEAWAVTLQKQGHLREAQVRFEQVLQLDHGNLAAQYSLACNSNLQTGVKLSLPDVSQLLSAWGNSDRLQSFVRNEGPVDDPGFDYLSGMDFYIHRQYVQAAEMLQRARTLVPDALEPQMALAGTFNQLRMPGRSRPLIDHIREELQPVPANRVADANLSLLDWHAWLLQTNSTNAREVLRSLINRHPDDREITGRVVDAYLALNDLTNAMQLVAGYLAKTPDDLAFLNAKAGLLIESGRAAEAIPILDHVVALTNAPEARFNRAFAHLQIHDLASASNELYALQKSGNSSARLDFGFARLAEEGADTNSARRHLQLCVSNAIPGSLLWRQAKAYLQRLDLPAATR